MDNFSLVRVLLVGDRPQLFYRHQKYLERNGCECEFAECERAAWEMLGRRQFGIVLSLHTSRGSDCPSLAVLLIGTPTTLFYALRLEVGCSWVPLLRSGEDCSGVPGLSASEFANALDEVLKEIRAATVGTAYRTSASSLQDYRPA